MKKLILLFFVFFSVISSAQNTLDSLSKKEKKRAKKVLFIQNNDAFLSAGLLLSQSQIQDTRMSPLIFSGFGTGIDFKYLRYGNKSMKQSQLRLQYHAVNVDELADKTMHLGKFEYSYGLHKKIRFPLGSFYVGGSINNQFNTRIYSPLGNNALGADNSLSLAPTFFWIHKKSILKRTCFLAIHGGFNLVNFTIRYPQFTYTGIELQALSMNNYNRFFMEIQLLPRLKYSEENHFNFSYIFDVYGFSSNNDDKKIASYFNGIKIGFWLKTK